MIFHLINDVETDFGEEVPGIPQSASCRAFVISCVSDPTKSEGVKRLKQIEINFFSAHTVQCVDQLGVLLCSENCK